MDLRGDILSAGDGAGPRAAAPDGTPGTGHAALDEAAAKALLASVGIAVPKGRRLAATGRVAVEDLAGLAPPYALKALSDRPLHKSDLGAVQLGLADAAEVARAASAMARRLDAAGQAPTGFLVEEMAGPGVEIVIGGMTDPQFGPMIMLGAGGIHAEIMADAAFRLCPIGHGDAAEMIGSLRIAPILRGARGRPGVDLGLICDALVALGGKDGLFLRSGGRIAEFDINPLIARPDGLVAVDARFVLGPALPPAGLPKADVLAAFRPLFRPETIAVAGASARGVTAGNRFIRLLRETGYRGRVYPIHPNAAEIEGLVAHADFAAVPEPVDYAYLTVPARAASDLLQSAGGRVRFAQVMASIDSAGQAEWEADLAETGRVQAVRLIGPNCMGTHSPHGRFTFMEGAQVEAGPVGIACQSGGLGMDILRRGQALGLRLSGLVTLGNSIDVTPADLLDYFMADPATRVIGLYVEDVKDGRRFARLARRNAGRKPLVLLAGGLTQLGRAAAASHTGAMGSSLSGWEALACQSGAILTTTLDSFLDMLMLCQYLVPSPQTVDRGITLFGNGGGASVLATDAVDRAGLTLARPSAEAERAFAAIDLPPGASLHNPIDLPASVLKEEQGRVAARVLEINLRTVQPHATVIHLNLPVIMGYRHVEGFLPNLLEAIFGSAATRAGAGEHRLLVLRSDRSAEVDDWRRAFRTAAIRHGVPSFDEIPQAVAALAGFRQYEAFLAGHSPET